MFENAVLLLLVALFFCRVVLDVNCLEGGNEKESERERKPIFFVFFSFVLLDQVLFDLFSSFRKNIHIRY